MARPRFEVPRLVDYSEGAILEEIRRVAKLLGAPRLSRSDFEANSRVGSTTVCRYLGSWTEALKAAGLEHLSAPAPNRTKSAVTSRGMSADALTRELRRVAELLGTDTLTVEQFAKHSEVGAGAIRGRFGSWKKALETADLSAVSMGKRYSDAECMENLLLVWTHLGRAPKYSEMYQAPSAVGGKAYTTRWRTWNRALAAFVQATSDDTAPAVTPNLPPEAPRPRVSPEQRHEIALHLRFRVLKRDCFKCVLCGASPATDPTCELHVDHIIPWSKGGLTREDNLRALCKACNLGRGASG